MDWFWKVDTSNAQRFDPDLAQQLQIALESFCQNGVKENLIRFSERALDLVGGRLFEGYYLGKRDT